MYGYYSDDRVGKESAFTDLAAERHKADPRVDGISFKKEITASGVWERINVTTKEGADSLGRPIGIYDTLNLGRIDLLDSISIEESAEEIEKELCYVFDECSVYPERILVVGLGNPHLTPDSLGVEAARLVRPTLHISEFDRGFFKRLDCAEIIVCTPGVSSTTGLDSSVVVKGVAEVTAPNAVIAIDSLTSRSVERLGTTIQISNTGILPGGGLGGRGYAIDKATLGIPVIAIGMPTVIDSRMFSHKDSGRSDYPSMFVCPKEIGEIIDSASKIIAGGINRAFGLYA